jgi:hypothetical protein
VNLFDRAVAVDPAHQAALCVMVQHRLGLLKVDGYAVTDDRLAVVWALREERSPHFGQVPSGGNIWSCTWNVP